MTSLHFLRDQSGAVTVDWVVLTAGLVGLGLATMAVVNSGVEDLSGDVEAQLYDNTIIKTNFGGLPDWVPTAQGFLASTGVSGPAVNGIIAGIQTALDGDLTGDTPSLLEAYQSTIVFSDLQVARGQAVLNNTNNGQIDYTALANDLAALDGETWDAGDLQTTVANQFQNDPAAYADHYTLNGQFQSEMNAHRAHELQRRGELPQG